MNKTEQADAFTDLMSHLDWEVGCGLWEGDGYVETHPWMQGHPDLVGEFLVFMRAFRAEVEQRFEEE